MTGEPRTLQGRAQVEAEKYRGKRMTERPGLLIRDFRAGYECGARLENQRYRQALRAIRKHCTTNMPNPDYVWALADEALEEKHALRAGDKND